MSKNHKTAVLEQLSWQAAQLLHRIFLAHKDKRKQEVKRLAKELASLRDKYYQCATAH